MRRCYGVPVQVRGLGVTPYPLLVATVSGVDVGHVRVWSWSSPTMVAGLSGTLVVAVFASPVGAVDVE